MTPHLAVLMTLFALLGCVKEAVPDASNAVTDNNLLTSKDCRDSVGRGGLLLSRFNSFEQFADVVQIDYFESPSGPAVRLTHPSCGRIVTKIMETGISEKDFIIAREGTFWDRVQLGLKSPYTLRNRNRLMQIELLARRRPLTFGEGDVAFFDLALTMVSNISEYNRRSMTERDLGEKGYLNTFNHICAQALMTSIYSAEMADFISDTHERHKLPELITGEFNNEMLNDIEGGAVDNYLDMVNNEWGQILGRQLGQKYAISESMEWTPELLASYLNDVQEYCSWAFDIGFSPYRDSDEVVVRFVDKLNMVVAHQNNLAGFYN